MNDSSNPGLLELLLSALQAQTQALVEQTEAINRLADSNQALVSIVLDEHGGGADDEVAPLGRYMDGTPIRDGG